jgi:amidase
MNPIIFESATQILIKIKKQEITCLEVAKQFLKQIEIYNPQINAISDIRAKEDVLAEAEDKDRLLREGKILGPLHGIPMTVKDGFSVKGLIASNGNPRLKSNISNFDATLITRLKEAGAIIIGKSNIAFLALDWQTDNAWFGRTNNPYDLDRMVGGSSGGSAAALAAGFTPLELGTDAGGSIRVPAHCCGVCGIRTTEFALPNRGNMVVPNLPKLGRYQVSNGGFARNIDDLLLLTEVLWNGSIELTENPPVPFKQYSLGKDTPIRIAFAKNLGRHALSKSYQSVYATFLKKLATRFALIQEAKPQYDEIENTLIWGKVAGYDFAAALKGIPGKSFLTKWIMKIKYKHSLWAKAMAKGAGSTAYDYIAALDQKDQISEEFNAFFNDYDIWITPVALTEAITHHKTGKPITVDGQKIPYCDAFIPYNFPTTVTGHPIIVLPIGRTAAGMPVGVQIHGKRWHDYKLLQIAREVEKLTKGFEIPKMFGEA